MKKCFLITVLSCSILFFTYSGEALGQTYSADMYTIRQEIFKRIAETISMYKIGNAYDQGKIVLTDNEMKSFKAYALNIFEEASCKISIIENDSNFVEVKKYLPDTLVIFWNHLAVFTDASLRPEEKLVCFVTASGGDCFTYIQVIIYAIIAVFIGMLLLVTVIGIPIAFIIFMLAEAVLTVAPILWFLCVIGIV